MFRTHALARLGTLAAITATIGLAAPQALATGTRIDSMGGEAKYWTVEDEVNIFDFPSLLVRYGNMTYADNINAAFANTRFGFHLGIGDDFVLAAFGGRINSTTRTTGTGFDVAGNSFTGASGVGVGQQAGLAGAALGGPQGEGMNSFTATNPFAGPTAQNITDVDLKFGLIAALNIGETMRLGLMINALGDDGDTEQPENGAQHDRGALLMDIALGFGLDLVNAELELTLGVEFGFLEDFRDAGNAVTGAQEDLLQHWTASHFGLRFNARFRYDFDEQYKLIAYLGFNYGSQSVEQLNVNPAVPPGFVGGEWGGLDLKLGADLRMELFEDVFVVPGIGMRWAQISLSGGGFTDRDVDRLLSLPYYSVGVDLKVFDWLDLRFGAVQSIDFIRNSTTGAAAPGAPTSTTENRASDVRTTLNTGVGIHVPINESMLSLDVNVNPLFWVTGPDFISGTGPGFGVSGAIKYDW